MWLLLVAAGTGYFARCLQKAHRARPVTSGYGQNPRASPPTSAPSTPRSSSSPPRTMCDDSAIITSKPLYDTNQKGSSAYKDVALPCLETLLKPCLPGFGKGASEQEAGNEAHIRGEATSKDSHSKVAAFEDAKIWQQHSFGGICSDKSLLQVCEIPDTFLREVYVSGDSVSEVYSCVSPLTSHASSIEDVSVAKLLAKENVYLSGGLDPSHQVGNRKRMTSERLVPTNVSAYEPVEKVLDNITGKDQKYVFSNPHPDIDGGATRIHNLKDHCKVKDGSTLQTKPLSKFPYGANTTLSNIPMASKVSQIQDSGCIQLDKRRPERELKTRNQEGLSRESERVDSTKTCATKETRFEADTWLRRSCIRPTILSDLESSGQMPQSKGELLFGFGVAIAVLFMISLSKREIQKMGMVLQEAEELVRYMRSELDSRKASISTTSVKVDAHTESSKELLVKMDLVDKNLSTGKAENLTECTSEENLTDDDDSARSVLTEEHIQDDFHISKLEAELEAELELIEFNINSQDSLNWEARYSANLEPNVEDNHNFAKSESRAHCQPTEYDWENYKTFSVLEEVNANDYMVSPVELERRLWNLLQHRQEEQIMELESALKSKENELCLKEKELQWWKDHVKWLTKFSFTATSGEESLRNSIEEGSVENKPWWILLEEQETLPIMLKSSENEMGCSVSGFEKFIRDEGCGGEGKTIPRTVSSCSFSSEESALSDGLSLEIVASHCQGCEGSIQPVQNCRLSLYTVDEPDSEKPSPQNQLCCIGGQLNTHASSP